MKCAWENSQQRIFAYTCKTVAVYGSLVWFVCYWFVRHENSTDFWCLCRCMKHSEVQHTHKYCLDHQMFFETVSISTSFPPVRLSLQVCCFLMGFWYCLAYRCIECKDQQARIMRMLQTTFFVLSLCPYSNVVGWHLQYTFSLNVALNRVASKIVTHI